MLAAMCGDVSAVSKASPEIIAAHMLTATSSGMLSVFNLFLELIARNDNATVSHDRGP